MRGLEPPLCGRQPHAFPDGYIPMKGPAQGRAGPHTVGTQVSRLLPRREEDSNLRPRLKKPCKLYPVLYHLSYLSTVHGRPKWVDSRACTARAYRIELCTASPPRREKSLPAPLWSFQEPSPVYGT
jgi:hypothetical protein